MYEYTFYKDEELTHAVSIANVNNYIFKYYYKTIAQQLIHQRGMSTSVGTLPILHEAQFLRITSSFIVRVNEKYEKANEQKEYVIIGIACLVAIVLPFLQWLSLSANGKVKSE